MAGDGQLVKGRLQRCPGSKYRYQALGVCLLHCRTKVITATADAARTWRVTVICGRRTPNRSLGARLVARVALVRLGNCRNVAFDVYWDKKSIGAGENDCRLQQSAQSASKRVLSISCPIVYLLPFVKTRELYAVRRSRAVWRWMVGFQGACSSSTGERPRGSGMRMRSDTM